MIPAPRATPPEVYGPPKELMDWMRTLISPTEGANPHVLLEGQSGSGKSLAAKHIAFERMKMGQEVNVVDVHTPEAWMGAANVFQGSKAGSEAAAFIKESLEARKTQKAEATARGEQPDFKPMTIVFSDFARLMKDTPRLGEEFRTLLTEARKFRISIVADTTALTGAATGIKGVQDVLNNFGQKVKFYAPTADVPRRAEVAGKIYNTPNLPDYKERIDYSLVKPETKELAATAVSAKGATVALAAVAAASAVVTAGFYEANKAVARYAEYSPALAQAQAEAEMVTILKDIRRAQDIGPELARFVEAQNELNNSWEDLKTELMKVAVPVMTVITKSLNGIVYILNGFKEAQEENAVGAMFDFNPFSIGAGQAPGQQIGGNIGGAVFPLGPEANQIL